MRYFIEIEGPTFSMDIFGQPDFLQNVHRQIMLDAGICHPTILASKPMYPGKEKVTWDIECDPALLSFIVLKLGAKIIYEYS